MGKKRAPFAAAACVVARCVADHQRMVLVIMLAGLERFLLCAKFLSINRPYEAGDLVLFPFAPQGLVRRRGNDQQIGLAGELSRHFRTKGNGATLRTTCSIVALTACTRLKPASNRRRQGSRPRPSPERDCPAWFPRSSTGSLLPGWESSPCGHLLPDGDEASPTAQSAPESD